MSLPGIRIRTMNSIKAGDIVTLSMEGRKELETASYPYVVRELYRNVSEGGGRVLGIKNGIVRLSIVNGAFPAGPGIENNFGIPRRCLMPVPHKEDKL